MARIRSIKPEFWTSAQILECSPTARLLFIGLWNFADDTGRHPHSAKQCKAEVFPADDLTTDDVEELLQELSRNGLIEPYTVEGKGYFRITGWKHQRIDKPQKPKYPPPPEYSGNDPGPLPPDTIGEDRKGKDTIRESPPSVPPRGDGDKILEIPKGLDRRRGKRLPEDWTLPEPWREEAVTLAAGRPLDVDAEAAKFRDHWVAKSGQSARKVDWLPAWRNWIRNHFDLYGGERAPPPDPEHAARMKKYGVT